MTGSILSLFMKTRNFWIYFYSSLLNFYSHLDNSRQLWNVSVSFEGAKQFVFLPNAQQSQQKSLNENQN